uniref:Response regulatory domain-containing protein n=1 Tax=Eutreptiella gymnastica TaxID=73025 RepID=A0A7S1N1F5_9EUGL
MLQAELTLAARATHAVLTQPCIVLVVDDTKMNLVLLEHMSRTVGAKVIAFDNGQAAVAYLSNSLEMPHLILTDIWMPQMNGFEFTSAVRQLNITTPIVAFTADGDPETERKAMVTGIKKLYQKPLTRNSFVDMCNTYAELGEDMPTDPRRLNLSPRCLIESPVSHGRGITSPECWT